jgi:oxygen-independent coproporphyrinogen-3 oxidase
LTEFKRRFYKNEDITSVYFGGGTPSLLPVWFISDFIDNVQKEFRLTPDAEITLEVNPKTIDKIKAMELKEAGVNRLSIGVQSIIDEDLKMLGRIHTSEEAKRCVFDMREVFSNISIDMIYNRPNQKIATWEEELIQVLNFPINHISAYELIVEDNTKIKKMIDSGNVKSPSDSDEFFKKTLKIMQNTGFDMYEVSNFAKDGALASSVCGGGPVWFNIQVYHAAPPPIPYGRHNISYWKYEDYYGVGPGSHSRVSVNNKKIAIEQPQDSAKWMIWGENPIFNEEPLSEDDEFKERVIMGLRFKGGINLNKFTESAKNKYDIKNKLKSLEENSYIITDDEYVALTYSGIMKLNLVIRYLTKE